VARCRVFDVRADLCRSPRTGEAHEFFVIECGDWVNVIPLTDDGEVLLVRQHRFGIDDLSLEIPGGMVDAGEDPLTAAGRELLEETGYAHRKLELLGDIHPNPALQKNRAFTYLATGCARHGAPSLDTCEDLELVKLPLSRIDHLLQSGQISHALVAVAFLHLKLRGSPTGMTP
jgi:8-oxo-dGTP pyrophosphatase MutT (NUDIX family)